MTTLERGAHEADNVYAFDPNEDDDADIESSRLPLLIAIALVVLAAFAGVVWLAYSQGVEEGRADAPRIASAQTHAAPAKSAANPLAGLNIYQPPASSDAGNEPIAPIPSGKNADSGDSQPPPLRPSANVADKPALSASVAAARLKPPAPSPAAAPKAVASAKPDATNQGVASLAPPTQAPAVPAREAESSSTTAAPSTPAAAGSAVALQIGSYKSDAEARKAWNRFKARHAIAASYGAEVKEVDLGEKGIWYRLRIGAFHGRRAAAEFCEKLEAQGASCIVSR